MTNPAATSITKRCFPRTPLQAAQIVFWLLVSVVLVANAWRMVGRSDSMQLAQHAGDCAAIGLRRPAWDDRAAFVRALPQFRAVYDKRIIAENLNGMRFAHSFALWYILRSMRPVPRVVVESGAHRGHSTWVIRQALPHATILSISPYAPDNFLPRVSYYIRDNFTDFGQMNWTSFDFDPKKDAVFFFDDHQSAYRRIFEEGAKFGFTRFIQEDNYQYLKGDSVSMKWLCEVDRKDKWRGMVPDDFGRNRTPQTWDEHIAQTKVLRDTVKHYYEFPPLLSQNETNSTRYVDSETAPPLLSDSKTAKNLIGAKYVDELQHYAHLCYVELYDNEE